MRSNRPPFGKQTLEGEPPASRIPYGGRASGEPISGSWQEERGNGASAQQRPWERYCKFLIFGIRPPVPLFVASIPPAAFHIPIA